MHLCFYLLKSLVACDISWVKGVINLIQDQLNVFFLGILALKRDTDVTHLLFVIVTLMLMSRSMNLNPISLIRWVVTVLFLVSLAYCLCLLLNLLKNHSRCIVVGRKLPQRLLPHVVIHLLNLTLFQFLCVKISVLVPLILSLYLSLITIYLHLSMLLRCP